MMDTILEKSVVSKLVNVESNKKSLQTTVGNRWWFSASSRNGFLTSFHYWEAKTRENHSHGRQVAQVPLLQLTSDASGLQVWAACSLVAKVHCWDPRRLVVQAPVNHQPSGVRAELLGPWARTLTPRCHRGGLSPVGIRCSVTLGRDQEKGKGLQSKHWVSLHWNCMDNVTYILQHQPWIWSVPVIFLLFYNEL